MGNALYLYVCTYQGGGKKATTPATRVVGACDCFLKEKEKIYFCKLIKKEDEEKRFAFADIFIVSFIAKVLLEKNRDIRFL